MSFTAGNRIGPYEIKGLLGAGGMGEVYRAHDRRLHRDVAIKVLPQGVSLDPDRLARLEREARTLAALSHRHIAAIYGIEELEGTRALVLELVEGSTLEERLARGPLALDDTLTIAAQIADAVETAHEQGIVHRDLKPSNIKLRPDGSVVVLDFGLATVRASAQAGGDADASTMAATAEGLVMGTAAYMSPEQARGRPVDRRTDIWSFGCVLFEMLAGGAPFRGDSVADVIAAVLQRDPDWSAIPPSTPAGVRELLRRCLERDPRQRLRDIGDARLVLEDALAHPVSGQSEPPGTIGARPGRQRRMLLILAAVAVGAAVITWAITTQVQQQSTVAGAQFDRVTRLIATPAHEFSPAISPDGKWVAYLSDARGPTDVWVKFIAGGDAVNLTASASLDVQVNDNVGGVEISPNGAQIAFMASPSGSGPLQQSTWVIDAPLGGVPRRHLPPGNQALRWSPDGKRIAFVRTGGTHGDALYTADADGQNEREIAPRAGGLHLHWPRWSADGAFLYYHAGLQPFNTEVTQIFRVPVSGGTPERVIQSERRAAFPFLTADGRGLIYAANPDSVDLSLWWRDLRTGRDRRVTSGVGEYSSPSLSADGGRLVGTVVEVRQTLQRVPLADDAPGRGEALSAGYTGDIDPCWSSGRKQLVFSSSRTGNRNIWMASADLSTPVPLTTGSAIDERPACSPDGGQIAFVSTRGGRRGIWVIGVDGGAPRLVAATEVLDTISWSPDGQKLVYAEPSENGPRLMIVTVADRRTAHLPTPGPATAPAWSPRDDVIAYLEPRPAVSTQLRFVRGDGTPNELVQRLDRIGNGLLAWSDDGRFLAGVAMPGNRVGHIWILDMQKPEALRRLLELPPSVNVRGITWSADSASVMIGHVRQSADIMFAERAQ